jgi:hypothetical protein
MSSIRKLAIFKGTHSACLPAGRHGARSIPQSSKLKGQSSKLKAQGKFVMADYLESVPEVFKCFHFSVKVL